jgi:predicted transposase YdaD
LERAVASTGDEEEEEDGRLLMLKWAALVAMYFLGSFPVVGLRAVCFVRAIREKRGEEGKETRGTRKGQAEGKEKGGRKKQEPQGPKIREKGRI